MKKLLIGSFLGVVVLVLVIHDVPLASHLATVERDRLTTVLERDAFILAGRAKESLETTPDAEAVALAPYVETYATDHAKATVVVTDWRGRAVATNDESVVVGEDYRNRPEITSALGGVPASGQRYSRTLGQDLLFVAVPVLLGDDVVGAVRISYPASEVDDDIRSRVLGVLSVGLISLLAVAMAAVALASFIVRPIRRLTGVAQRLASGDLTARAADEGPREIRELSSTLNTMAGRLAANLEHQRAFSGEVSHQLRTPLTALKLRLETADGEIARGRPGSPVVAESIAAARSETERMQAMVEQLLALARLEGGVAPTVVVDAVAVARERVEMWQPLAEEHGVEIAARGLDTARCRAVEGGLEQVLDNLIDNALAVSKPGGTITVEVGVSDRSVLVEVVDDGPGMSPGDREAAFGRFWSGRSASQDEGGSGLGLAIVRQLSMAAGGTAELLAANEDGSGIRARVALPVAHAT
jgi:signal transduction histidine kinase